MLKYALATRTADMCCMMPPKERDVDYVWSLLEDPFFVVQGIE